MKSLKVFVVGIASILILVATTSCATWKEFIRLDDSENLLDHLRIRDLEAMKVLDATLCKYADSNQWWQRPFLCPEFTSFKYKWAVVDIVDRLPKKGSLVKKMSELSAYDLRRLDKCLGMANNQPGLTIYHCMQIAEELAKRNMTDQAEVARLYRILRYRDVE